MLRIPYDGVRPCDYYLLARIVHVDAACTLSNARGSARKRKGGDVLARVVEERQVLDKEHFLKVNCPLYFTPPALPIVATY